eukprot:scaffold133908_cov60-Phaeocystis_antarctica.AAC.2
MTCYTKRRGGWCAGERQVAASSRHKERESQPGWAHADVRLRRVQSSESIRASTPGRPIACGRAIPGVGWRWGLEVGWGHAV